MTLGIKTGRCRICEKEKKTEWHHIISQHHAKKTGQDHLIYNPNNVVELCKKCHNQTTASKCRYRFKKEKEINQKKEYIQKRKIERTRIKENQKQPKIENTEKEPEDIIYQEITEVIKLVTEELTKAKRDIKKEFNGILSYLLLGK